MTNNQPDWKLRQGGLSAAAWHNEKQSANGGTYEQQSVLIERRYKDDRTGDWKSSHSYTVSDLLALRHFLGRVIDRALEEESRQSGGEGA